MIELKKDSLVFSFPEVHREAELRISFQRTLRIPDDDKTYFLPPGLGRFPLEHVDDFANDVPREWLERGGVMFPMYQSEAMWIFFDGSRGGGYPFAVKIATGKVNAISGKPYENGLNRKPQDYVAVPGQPWLDGYSVEKGIIRQFVAMPLGAGYTAEEQITGKAEFGGLQIIAYPMKAEVYERLHRELLYYRSICEVSLSRSLEAPSMGLAPGGRMKQEIFEDKHDLSDYDLKHWSRCFVHISNSLVWRRITGKNPPTTPPTAREYTNAGLPWFDYYDDNLTPLEGSGPLKALKSVASLGKKKKQVPLPENEPVSPENIIVIRKGLGLKKSQVREWAE